MKRLFVGNLSFHTTDAELRTLFEQFGEVGSVEVPKDRDTGRARGFAFVEMLNDEDAGKAMAGLNGQEVQGRALNVNEARPKSEGGGRGGRPGGGGGRFRDEPRGAGRRTREPRW
jgi:RNA recognition motif-containing protein